MVKVEVRPSQVKSANVESVWIEIDNLTKADLTATEKFLQASISREKKVSKAVADAFVFAVKRAPHANPSDVWQHVIYRKMIDLGYSDQQWKRISGFALEIAICEIYSDRLGERGLRFRTLPRAESHKIFQLLGFGHEIKKDKVDCIVEVDTAKGWVLKAGIHVKASLAERIQDDVPASLALMSRGILSIVLTMDSKSFPPPHGDGVNYGELGGRNWQGDSDENYRIKRQYLEINGQFDALFSYNLRTPPSGTVTPSGKKIFTQGFFDDHDHFINFLTDRIS